MKQIIKIFDYIFVMRPTLLFSVWAVFLAGFFVESKFGMAAEPGQSLSNSVLGHEDKTLLAVGGILTLLMGAVFILHQIMERQFDSKKQKPFAIARGEMKPRVALIEAGVLGVIGLGLGFAFSSTLGLGLLLIFIITGLLYSFSPFSLKDKPVMALMTNLISAVLIFSIGWMIRGAIGMQVLVFALPYACSIAALYLLNTVLDIKRDTEIERVTFGVKYGSKNTINLVVILQSIALITAYISGDEIIFYPALFSFPFFIWAAIFPQTPEILRAVRYSVMLLALAVSVKWIVTYSDYTFFYILVSVYFITKFYYKVRYGVSYPTLSG